MSLFKHRKEQTNSATKVFPPFGGIAKSLESIADGVISEKVLGDGMVVIPFTKEKYIDIIAPISGEVILAHSDGHSWQLRAENGVTLLIQVGLNSEKLKGKGIESFCNKGQFINSGEKMARIDQELLRAKTDFCGVIIVVTSGHDVWEKSFGEISIYDKLFSAG